ncbi:MAG: hypothetical protein MK137_07500 [Rickettsiales bacterium]|nr:hypothetical protein [Rickettsiales bacterium]
MIRSLSFQTNKRRFLAIIITLLLHIVIFAYFFYKYTQKSDVAVNATSQKTAMSLSWSETNSGNTDEEPETAKPKALRNASSIEPKPQAKPLELSNPITKEETEEKEVVEGAEPVPVTKPNIAFKPIPKPKINAIRRNLNKQTQNDQTVEEYAEYSTLPTSRAVTIEDYIGDNKKPNYPKNAVIRNLEGNVELDALINHLGEGDYSPKCVI